MTQAVAARHPVLCAHADGDGRGAHWLRPGEKCAAERASRNTDGQDEREAGQVMQVWEAETDTDILVLREVLKLAETDPEVAAAVLEALYSQCGQHDRRTVACELCDIMNRAEEAPLLGPIVVVVP
jgi:hypothetical protein